VTIAVTSAALASSASAFELLTRFDTGHRAASSYTLILAASSLGQPMKHREQVALAEIQKVALRSRCPKRAFLPSGRAKKSADGSTSLFRYQNHQNGFLGAADKRLCLVIHSFL
jgi:hypothetical protein